MVVERDFDGEVLTVQLNAAENHTPGWIGVIWPPGYAGWKFCRHAD